MRERKKWASDGDAETLTLKFYTTETEKWKRNREGWCGLS
jgi:hypothetical protein